ncbi:hypothetical protein [Clostridium sp. Marseille-P299]|uniref:hypothetical protein n=1 Tax=Clostridium sp. Marseille-P299 TaxID=1805477 RepID=UPI00082CB52B|nr:hypothetical protein [Clostridium sp. Marseille-P299]
MERLKLNKAGFITNYLVSGPKETDFLNNETDDNQLRYEQYLRTIVADQNVCLSEGEIQLGKDSSLGMPWRYYYHYGNWFVDESTFYSTLQKVELDAVTRIDVVQDLKVEAIIWSYAAIDVWCNQARICNMHSPVYKPIQKVKTVLDLKKGSNQIYIKLQTLGVRDTRTLFGIQILNHQNQIQISLPDQKHTDELIHAEQWLNSIQIKDSTMTFHNKAPQGAWLAYDSQSPDFAQVNTRKEWIEISGQDKITLDENKPGVILVRITIGDTVLTRKVENILAQKPVYGSIGSYEENRIEILKRIAKAESLSRGDKFGFSISNILARKYLGMDTKKDRDLLLETLNQIESRFDCSDFLVCGLVRYLKNYEVDDELYKRAKDVLLNWRYWMNQNGSDAMCFWSENHSLMFYACAMQVGEMFPQDYFKRANMTGLQLSQFGREKVLAWLDDVETNGFEEFLSTVYMCVTFAALLNVIDYSDLEISNRATKVTDRLLEMLCQHTYDGCVIAPMGRVYREVIHPFAQGAQALMNLINPEVPYTFGEGWLGFYASSKYKIPERLISLMDQPLEITYTTGNALIHLNKSEDYCLTSVQSPVLDENFKRWENLTLNPDADPTTCEYTKSLNERFHGTTCFEPGVYGYQQHMWYAALDKETDVFTNHPGGTCDSSSMRPGFWFGNGVMPAIMQNHNKIGIVYHIPEEHPIHFTHVYFPTPKFEEIKIEEHWLFGKKKHGYVAIWCNQTMESENDQVFGCEYRTYGDDIAYFCICGSDKDFATMEEFKIYAKEQNPKFDVVGRRLKAEDVEVTFIKSNDRTQYI